MGAGGLADATFMSSHSSPRSSLVITFHKRSGDAVVTAAGHTLTITSEAYSSEYLKTPLRCARSGRFSRNRSSEEIGQRPDECYGLSGWNHPTTCRTSYVVVRYSTVAVSAIATRT
jgi:hypothetical protein